MNEPPNKPNLGRPRIDEERLNQILEKIAEGESLNAICSHEGLPASGTILRHASEDKDFGRKYELALRIRAEHFAEELITLCDLAKEAMSPEQVAALKLRVNTRQWIISRLLPKKYGDRASEVTVNNINNAIILTEERRAELIARRKEIALES